MKRLPLSITHLPSDILLELVGWFDPYTIIHFCLVCCFHPTPDAFSLTNSLHCFPLLAPPYLRTFEYQSCYDSQTCKRYLNELRPCRLVWLRTLLKILHQECIPPHTFPIHQMSARQLEDVCTRPGRIRYFAKNASAFRQRYGSKPNYHHHHHHDSRNYYNPTFERTRFYLSADLSGYHTTHSAVPETTPTPTLTGRPPFVIPGGRWIVGTALHQGRLQILCWDLQTTTSPPPQTKQQQQQHHHHLTSSSPSLKQRLSNYDPPPTLLPPASSYTMAHVCHPWVMFAFGPPQADVDGRTVRFLSLYWNPTCM